MQDVRINVMLKLMTAINPLGEIIANVSFDVFKYASFDETGSRGVFIENAILATGTSTTS